MNLNDVEVEVTTQREIEKRTQQSNWCQLSE